MESPERARLDAFFRQVTAQFPAGDAITTLVITHLLPERPAFLRAMTAVSTVGAVLPKPRSIHQPTLDEVRHTFTVHDLTRERFTDDTQALDYLEETAGGRDIVLVDIGGYFAASLDTLVGKFSGRILGVVEDTENGHQRYAALDSLPCPVVSVARSPLKDCEDHLVGRSIVFSTDALVRTRGDILTSRNACVIGFGKIGRAIAQTLRAQDLRVTVYDSDPIKRVQAHSLGFHTSASTTEAVRDAGLVLCATGNLALRQGDFAALRNGAYLGSVTSSEDELELGSLHDLYERSPVSAQLTRYEVTGHYFYVLADGGAVNFVHPAHVTCSAIVIDSDRRMLHILHAASGMLLAPGGHNEPDDRDLRDAALRELYEEAGIPPSVVVPLAGYEDVPLDIDVHTIDANPLKDEPVHYHVDFRWGFLLGAEHALTLQEEEVDGYEWRTFTSAASPTIRAKLTLLT